MRNAKAIWQLLRETLSEWTEDRVPRLGAALAYYTIFSLAPLIIIATVIAGSFFGGQATAQERLVAQISQFVGSDAAQIVNNMVTAARLPSEAGNITITIGVVTLLLGAMAVFVQLQDAFDTIWEVTPNPRAGFMHMLRIRLLSFLLLLGVGFLLLALMLTSTVLTAVGSYLEARMANYGLFAALVNGVLPFVFSAVLFAIMFKVLSNVRLAWRDVVPGALLTALLFSLGRSAIGLYLGSIRMNSGSTAASSVLVVLIWVYFSAQILFLGAEFTQVYVKHYGRYRPDPSPESLPVSEAERAQQGMPHKAAVEAAAARATPAHKKGRLRLPLWRRAPETSTSRAGQGGLGILVGFLAGLGTGAVMAALTLRGGSQRGL